MAREAAAVTMDLKPTAELTPDTEVKAIPADLKVRINDLLWDVLPDDTTLRQADDLALQIFYAIVRAWHKTGSAKCR